VVVAAALEDARLVPPLPDCGVVIGLESGSSSVVGTIGTAVYIDANARTDCGNLPMQAFVDTLPHMSATHLRVKSVQRAVLAPMAACATGIWAIARFTCKQGNASE